MKAELQPGFHVNSNMPGDDYLIPIKLTWNKDPLEAEQVTYPKPQKEKLSFSPNPISVYTGTFDIATRFKAPAERHAGHGLHEREAPLPGLQQQGVPAAAHGGCSGHAGYSIRHRQCDKFLRRGTNASGLARLVHVSQDRLICFGLLLALFLLLITHNVSSEPYVYDEADYMYAASLGFAANWSDTPSIPIADFVRAGLSGDGRKALSERIRGGNDVLFYRHFHGPLFITC